MKGIKRSQKKGKLNPMRTCKVCGVKIYNKLKNALYCLKCTLVVNWAAKRIASTRYQTKKYYPDYEIKITWKVVKNV